MASKYCYDDGKVLINKFGIRDIDKLDELERSITTFKIAKLNCGERVIVNYFTVNDYLALHKYIFSDIYSFAGEIRDEAISKSNKPYRDDSTPFCYPSFIYQNLDYYLKEMKRNVRKIKTREDLVKYISYYYSEINIIHPFREGNGRTLREYMKLLVDYISKYLPLDEVEISYSLWNKSDRENLLEATIYSTVTGDISKIVKCFDKVIVYKDNTKVKSK